MSLIAPDAPYSVQQALAEVGRRLRILERGHVGEVTQDALDEVASSLRVAINEATKRPTTLDPESVFKMSGGAHEIGFVPDPGPIAGTIRFLREDATWVDVVDQPYSWRYSSGQLFGTGDTNLTSYDHTFLADGINVGDTLHIFGTFLGGTAAGTKSLTLAIGTGTPVAVCSSTYAASGSARYHFNLQFTVRSATSISCGGSTIIGPSNALAAETYLVNVSWAVADIAANTQLFRWVGKNTGSSTESKMTDMFIRRFRANGRSALV